MSSSSKQADKKPEEKPPEKKKEPRAQRRVVVIHKIGFDIPIPDAVLDNDKVDYATKHVDKLIEALNRKKGDVQIRKV